MSKSRVQFGDYQSTAVVVTNLPKPPEFIALEIKGGLNVHDKNVPPTEPEPAADPGPTGLVTIRGHLEMNDYESFGNDEHMKLDNLIAWTYVDNQFVQRFYWEGRCGGELRLEVDMLCGINPSTPDVLDFAAHARLYEGTSSSTTDLDGADDFHIQVDRGTTRGLFGLVRNTAESQPADWGIFSFGVQFD